jgi:hypothetical protein
MRLRFTQNSNVGPKPGLFHHFCQGLAAACVLLTAVLLVRADVPSGSLEEAKKYYKKISKDLKYATPEKIGDTTLSDLATYLGYKTLTAQKLEFDPPEKLKDNGAAGDVLVSRFFAPKIMNVKFSEDNEKFKLGWRRLVRLKAQAGSTARENHIASAVILFNTFTKPTDEPFGKANFSVNTQVMLLPDPAFIRPLTGQPGDGQMDSVYWLDYQSATADRPGKLGFALDASFDANNLPGEGIQPYFVPHGCVACHGNNDQRSLLNFLDTDHWFDRLNNDFPEFKKSKRPLLFDAGTNDPADQKFKDAIDVIRTFNTEAHAHAKQAQPKHDESLAAAKWLEIHKTDYGPVPPIKRTIGADPQWSAEDANEVAVLGTMNQYCYRCHGTVKFSVFNKGWMLENRAKVHLRLATDAEVGLKMPLDRDIPKEKRDQLLKFFKP